MTQERFWTYGLPALVAVAMLGIWECLVYVLAIKPIVLPAPSDIARAAIEHWEALANAAWVTIRVTVMAFLVALTLGTAFATLFAQSRTMERALLPYAITLQVTPIVAIAPLILIWVGFDNAERAVLILATIVAFFPILANSTLGLRSADRQLHELFDLYGASRWQRLIRLQFPAALPNILTGMKISGGLALIGAVVAEFAAGSGTATGLAWLIQQSVFNLKIAKAFAALGLLAVIGIAIYALLSLLERQALKHWHESARANE